MRTKLSYLYLITVTGLFSGCATSSKSDTLPSKNCKVSVANKWYMTSAEKKILYSEIFTLSQPALLSNKQHLAGHNQICGVILDIDETLLDNSLYQYNNDKQCSSFTPDTWNAFVNRKISIALPGASEITHYIHSLGCKVNLVSGRSITTLKATEENLKQENIYYDQILLATDILKTDKNSRFNAISNGITPSKFGKQIIIGYYGDNIEDFPNTYQNTYNNKIESISFNNFGKIYFVLPNPVYGSWLKNKLQ